ncbi:DUF4349 domain-containing protein [Aeromicrobium sp. YIM 150415]|uniref:DUF4349 domain-containing protein n=1 Tax=Aeromicrobium sp. YIM 150415 TaxID=2803912 RepID=UPI00196587F6|nr:DUF4349 domain-containing protein [Aeromicrobium sp. YIM 150415]MBM9461995.1 DUF4349 domain-containing protein [Aeromicrobium sp. YIM 150415]
MTSLDDILTPERREEMRSQVLTEVRGDIAKRARPSRGRMVVGALATAAALAVVAGVGVQALSVFTPSSSDSSDSSVSSLPADSPGQAESAPGAEQEDAPQSLDQADRVVVTTGSARVEVDDVPSAVDAIVAFATAEGGRIDAQEQQSDGRARLTVRVAPDAVPRLTSRLDELGAVEDVSISRSDETATAVDLAARIRSLEVSTARLEAIMAEADSSQDLLATEQTLAERQSELESLQAQQAALEGRSELASIEVVLSARPGPQAVDPGGFIGGLQGSWNALNRTAEAGLTVAGALVPWSPFLLAAVGLWWWRRRRIA